MIERTQDRLFLLRLVKELPITDPIILEKIVFSLQLILLKNRKPMVFSYRFIKSRHGVSERTLFSDIRDLRRADLIRYDPYQTPRIWITEEGKQYLEEFSDLLDEERMNNFSYALKIWKKTIHNKPDMNLQETPIVLGTEIGKYIFA